MQPPDISYIILKHIEDEIRSIGRKNLHVHGGKNANA